MIALTVKAISYITSSWVKTAGVPAGRVTRYERCSWSSSRRFWGRIRASSALTLSDADEDDFTLGRLRVQVRSVAGWVLDEARRSTLRTV